MQLSLENDREDHSVIRHYIGMSMNQMRHLAVSRIVEQHQVETILDLGCSEGLLLQKLARNQHIRLVVGVDLDATALSSAVLNTFPENIQQSIQFRREEDQHVFIYRADATKKYPQLKQKRAKLVTLVELIEHLPLQDVPKIVDNVFGYLQPQLCFISTPNQEFNVFFDLSEGQMRHWDHKFQWRRDEFKSFCEGIKQKYGYQFILGGIGQHISDESRGHCTQYALFTRTKPIKHIQSEETEIMIKRQESGQKQQLQQRAHYENKSWHNNLEKIISNTLFKSLYYNQNLTLDEGVEFILKEPIGECLLKKGERINREYLIDWLQKLSNDFQWNQEIYRTKQTQQQSEKMDQS